MIHIRNASEADFPIIQEIAQKTWPNTFSAILSPGQISYMLDMMYSTDSLKNQTIKNGHRFLLAFLQESSGSDVCIGYASYELNYSGENRTKIHKIYILPNHQGEGAGLALINKIEEIAISCNEHNLFLNVNKNNPAITFYKRLGFDIIREEKIPIGNGFFMDDYVMQKCI
ncbi:MAG: GNAT family N-acetyltransferase [Bacteroidetes bacterium GWE2_39_28]|nr:MAG: GNAT family N-acetyltransferase [Bacteroidetes bacterium GWE2_39_28]OFY16028.1 MAG: GNAT family N-acetyltransferase [Bacteroidetes bacterium GWF2_39_10]OFZ11906.1 MAG: GNAT family N-acetyltransferase [Bacteroidetes bacterium RIFOXYC2_FULL_39_11]HCT94384.1 GNAT family N-acetyltransferase [Rikenellaceae bacterium]